MKFWIDELNKRVLYGVSDEYHIEVCHGGWGGQFGDKALMSLIIKTVKCVGEMPNQWNPEATIHISFDKVAASWVIDATTKIVSGDEMGLRSMFQKS